jgi:carbamoyltransferase
LERARALGFTVIEHPSLERIADYVANYKVVGRCIEPM